MNQARAFKINVITAVIVAAMITLFLVYLIASDDIQLPWEYHQPEILLDCTLPSDRPIMDAPTVIVPEINNTTDARNYASRYFPQFSDIEFTEEDDSWYGRNAEYTGEIGDELIFVQADGEIIYSTRDVTMSVVSEEDFPKDVARACSTAFIETHGGIGSYEEVSVFTSSCWGEQGFEGIGYHWFVYHKRYNGYLIYGFDDLMTTVYPDGPTVFHYVRRERQYGGVNETCQVIPAEVAWWAARNTTNIDFMDDIKINHVELCYYFETSNDITTMLYPAWRFSNPDIDIYVNAFTGVVMG